MSLAEAEANEKAILDNVEDTGYRLLKMREEKGFVPMGFEDFKSYCKSLEEKMSVGKIYHLMDQAEVNKSLSDALGREVHLPVSHALALKDLEPEQRVRAFKEATKDFKKGDPKPTESVFRKVADKLFGRKRSKAAGKSKTKAAAGDDKAGWTEDELAEDLELVTSIDVIESVYGSADADAIRKGTLKLKRADVIFLARLPKERMEAIQDLLFETRWTPEQCIKFINTDVDADSSSFYDDIKYQCLTQRAKFWSQTFDDGAFTVSIKLNRAAKR
jgi:hypothetical protein